MRKISCAMFLVLIAGFAFAPASAQEEAQPFSRGLVAPFPSDVYTRDDPESSTGVRVLFSEYYLRPELVEALPEEMQPEALAKADGFSCATPMTLVFKEPVDHKRLLLTPEESISDDARIRLIDVETGRAVPYVVHKPVMNPAGRDPLTFVRLYPYARLLPGRGYVLFATDDVPLRKKDAKPERFALFERFFSGSKPANEREAFVFERLRPYLDAALSAGADMSKLVILTGFTIRTDENAIGPMVRAGKAVLAEPAPEVMIDKVRRMPGKDFVRVEGSIEGPAIIDDEGKLQWDEGELKIDGTVNIPFIMFLPLSAEQDPAPLLLYCEGGPPAKRKSYKLEFTRKKFLNEGIAFLAIDSPSGRDLDEDGEQTRARTSFPGTVRPGDNTAEMCQWAIDIRTIVNAVQSGGFDVLPRKNPDGVPDLDKERVAYTGISYGGVNGAVFTAFEPRFSASVLQVAGSQWVALPAEHFVSDLVGEKKMYAEGVLKGERPFFLAASQMVFDLIEPSVYAAYTWGETLYDGAEPVPVFFQAGYKDGNVHTSEPLAAVMGLIETPGETFSGLPEGAKCEFYSGFHYPFGHMITALKKTPVNDRFEFLIEHLK